MTNEALLLDYADRQNRASFEQLVHRFDREIFTYLRRYLGSDHLAEDAVQGTFLALHQKCGQFDGGRKVRPWLYRIATNQANDLLRRNRRHRAASLDTVVASTAGCRESSALGNLLADPQCPPTESLEAAEQCQRVAAAVKQLPERLKQPILLVIYQGLKYREAASAIGIPLGTLKSRLSQAIEQVARLLERRNGVVPDACQGANLNDGRFEQPNCAGGSVSALWSRQS